MRVPRHTVKARVLPLRLFGNGVLEFGEHGGRGAFKNIREEAEMELGAL